jgi:hypothetical protein
MQISDTIYLANLAFLLNYEEGVTKDEIEYEIFKISFQQKETIHYDRIKGGGFQDLEQDPANIATALMYSANLVESIFYINQEKGNNPYIVVGHNDITINDETTKSSGEYVVRIEYKLLQDINKNGVVTI